MHFITAPGRKRSVAELACLGGMLCLFLVACGFSAPVLRHDWQWWPGREGLAALLEQTTSPWLSSGFGTLTLYQPNVPFAAALLASGPIGNASLSFVLYMLLIAGVCLWAVRDAVTSLGVESATLRSALCAVFLFNPWTYTEIVAGHAFMVFALAMTLLLFIRTAASTINLTQTTILLALLIPQLQFFLVACIYVAVAAIVRRRYMLLIAPPLCALPVLINILGNRGTLLGTVHTLPWLYNLSVEPNQAVFLLGYFAGYTKPVASIFTGAMVLLLLGTFGIVIRNRRALPMLLVSGGTLVLVLLSQGLKGPLKEPLSALFSALPEFSLYRELYDVLGFVLAGYIVLCALEPRPRWWSKSLVVASAATMMAIWIAHPPRAFWTGLGNVPHVAVQPEPHSRFALIPAFQPLSFEGRGSGIDPDAFPRGGDQYPVNETFPTYPVERALATFQKNGDSSELAALSVSQIIVRPHYAPAPFQAAVAGRLRIGKKLARYHPIAFPEMSMSGTPNLGTLNRSLAADGIFFADVTSDMRDQLPLAILAGSFANSVSAPIDTTNERAGWIDARLIFTRYPELAQAHGGAYTEAPGKALSVKGPFLLVNVDGKLLTASGRKIAGIVARRFQWAALPPGVDSVRCRGRCLVALQGRPPPNLPLEPVPVQSIRTLPFKRIFPWLLVAQLPDRRWKTIRYNVRFTTGWAAYTQLRPLPHFRFDTIANGWLLPSARERGGYLVLVETTAAEQVAAYAFILLAATLMAYHDYRKPLRRIVGKWGFKPAASVALSGRRVLPERRDAPGDAFSQIDFRLKT